MYTHCSLPGVVSVQSLRDPGWGRLHLNIYFLDHNKWAYRASSRSDTSHISQVKASLWRRHLTYPHQNSKKGGRVNSFCVGKAENWILGGYHSWPPYPLFLSTFYHKNYRCIELLKKIMHWTESQIPSTPRFNFSFYHTWALFSLSLSAYTCPVLSPFLIMWWLETDNLSYTKLSCRRYQKRFFLPWPGDSVGWNISLYTKNCGFNSWSGHIPRLWVQSTVRGCMGGNW